MSSTARPIRRVAVLGAGVMGSGIAAHCANAGIPVVLLDIVPPKNTDPSKAARDAFAAGALAKTLKAKPAAFMHPRNALLVSTGNLEDDLAKTADCDLVIEAVIERLDIKQALFAKLEAIAPNAIIASNTSGLRIADMLQGRTEQFKKQFVVTHFFNPPRYMKLLELVAGPETTDGVKATCEKFGKEILGKGIVWAKDTPNFIGNRIGLHSMMTTIHLMLERGLSPEDVDAITGIPMAHPKSATFRTADVVGLDTVGHVAANCYSSLTTDEDRETFKTPAYITALIEQGILGDKTKGGFYRRSGNAGPGGKDIQTLDPTTGEYRAKGGNPEIASATKSVSKIEDPRERVKKLVDAPGITGEFAWTVLSRSLAYAARRIPEITESIEAIDNGMKWGYAWDLGPFEVWDALGTKQTIARMRKDGVALPAWIDKVGDKFYDGDKVFSPTKGEYLTRATDPREIPWEVMRRGTTFVVGNRGAEAWDLGDGVLGLTFKSDYNSIDDNVISMIHQAVDVAEKDFRALVIFNHGDNFCVGANLMAVVMAAMQKQWDQLRKMIRDYQYGTQRLKYSTIPVVAAPFAGTMGGGLELCMGSDAVQAAAETYAGLVEVGVGLIPGGAGTMNMLWRSLESVPEGVDPDVYGFVTQTFKNIALAKYSTSAEEAKALGFFRNSDGVSFDRARHLYETKQRALGLANAGYHPAIPRAYKLPGENGIATLKMMVNTLVAGGYATAHDALIAMKLAHVLCGGSAGHTQLNTEDQILELEREAFLSLCGEPLSQARMQYFLQNKKPLRN